MRVSLRWNKVSEPENHQYIQQTALNEPKHVSLTLIPFASKYHIVSDRIMWFQLLYVNMFRTSFRIKNHIDKRQPISSEFMNATMSF